MKTKSNKSSSARLLNRRRSDLQTKFALLGFVALFVVAGSVLLLGTHAATDATSDFTNAALCDAESTTHCFYVGPGPVTTKILNRTFNNERITMQAANVCNGGHFVVAGCPFAQIAFGDLNATHHGQEIVHLMKNGLCLDASGNPIDVNENGCGGTFGNEWVLQNSGTVAGYKELVNVAESNRFATDYVACAEGNNQVLHVTSTIACGALRMSWQKR